MEFNALKRGDAIRIRFGAKSSQFAIVHDWTRAGNCRVWKYSATRRVWKGPLRLWEHELIGEASPMDEQQVRKPLPTEFRTVAMGYNRNPIRELG